MTRSRRNLDEKGTGLLGSAIGLAIIIGMLGFAVNVTVGLWTRSTVDSIAYDSARRVATTATSDTSVDPTEIEAAAIADAKALLGEYGDKVRMDFIHDGNPDEVTLRVRAPGIALLPKIIKGGPVVGSTDRQIVIRRERQ